MKSVPLLIASLLLLAASAPLAAAADGEMLKDGMHRIYPGDGDYLVVLHGWTTGYDNMRDACRFFQRAGYHVVSLRYPVRKATPATLINDHIRPGIAKHCTDPERQIHFLTHSLGGVLLREYLRTDRPDKLGKVVMLGAPNNGIELVDRLVDRRGFARFFGPTVVELRTGEDSWPRRLGKADFPLGIIMGNTRLRVPFTSRFLPGSDDGIVSAQSGQLEGMRQLIEVSAFHTALAVRPAILQRAEQFFRTGSFDEAVAAPAKPATRFSERRAKWRERFAPGRR